MCKYEGRWQDAAADLRVPGGRAARARRLAAVEPLLRRPPQCRHRAVRRRDVVPGRWQADAEEFGRTLANLREIAPAVCFNVPKGFEMLAAVPVRRAALVDDLYARRDGLAIRAGEGGTRTTT